MEILKLISKDSHSRSNRLPEIFISLIVLIITFSCKTTGENDLSILDHLLKGYDRRALPESLKGKPTPVACEIYIRSFGSINPATMDYEVDLYLRQTWLDERLKTPRLSKPLDLNDAKLVQMIWKPEVFFANAKHAEFQYVTVPNVLVRINPNGTILYMLRLKLRFSCMMDLYRFPMDSQVCAIELASFSKTTDELQLKWKETNPIVLYENLKLPQFQIEHWNTSLCKEKFQFGEYSCLKAEFYLQRSLGYHLVQSYLPTSLIVFISWVSFWLDIDAIPARVTLGVTTLLTISSKGSGIQTNLPPVSYVKAIDVWMGACTTFVFAALLEFTCVNYLWRKRCKRRANQFRQTIANLKANHNSNLNTSTTTNSDQTKRDEVKGSKLQFNGPSDESIGIALARFQGGGGHGSSGNGNDHYPNVRYQLGEVPVASGIDRICRFLFPMLFLLFNTVYWPYYIY